MALIDHIDPLALALGVEVQNCEQAIRLLADKLQALGYVKPTYADAVVKREAAMPTGLPLGQAINVAIPHTDPEHVIRPGVVLGVLSARSISPIWRNPTRRCPSRSCASR